MQRNLFHKVYDGESIADMERDVLEALNPDFSDEASMIKCDEYGFAKGEFIVSIEYKFDHTE